MVKALRTVASGVSIALPTCYAITREPIAGHADSVQTKNGKIAQVLSKVSQRLLTVDVLFADGK